MPACSSKKTCQSSGDRVELQKVVDVDKVVGDETSSPLRRKREDVGWCANAMILARSAMSDLV
jgi:hypothetical protein